MDLIVISLIRTELECFSTGWGRDQELSNNLTIVQAEAICASHKHAENMCDSGGREMKTVALIPSTLPLCWPASRRTVCFCFPGPPTRPDLDMVTQQIFKGNLESVPEHTVNHRLWTPAELAPACLTKTLRATTDSASHNSQLNWDSMIKKDIWMWVSLVARLGYCSTHGLRNVTGRTLSSPNRPLSMTSGGIVSSNCSPGTGCPPWHQRPFLKNSGGL